MIHVDEYKEQASSSSPLLTILTLNPYLPIQTYSTYPTYPPTQPTLLIPFNPTHLYLTSSYDGIKTAIDGNKSAGRISREFVILILRQLERPGDYVLIFFR